MSFADSRGQTHASIAANKQDSKLLKYIQINYLMKAITLARCLLWILLPARWPQIRT